MKAGTTSRTAYVDYIQVTVTYTADGTPPTTASVTSPVDGSAFRSSTAPTSFSGSAADNTGGSGLAANSTTFTLRNPSGQYWNGSIWQTLAFPLATTHSATSGGNSTTWTSSANLPSWSAQADGTYTVKATATDNGGNSYAGPAISFTLDNTAPTVRVDQAAAQSDPTNSTSIQFAVVFSESVTGVEKSDFTVGGTATGFTVASVSGSGATYTVTVSGTTVTDGTVTLTMPAGGAADAVGNLNTASTATDNSVTYDGTPPSGTVEINSGATYATSTAVTLTLSATDGSGSGVAQMQFSNDGSSWSGWETYEATRSWPLTSGDGLKTVYVQFKDAAGNISTATISDQITLDSTLPSCSATHDPAANQAGWNNADVTVTLSASDSGGSGLKQIHYTVNGGGEQTVDSGAALPVFDTEGVYDIEYWAEDNAGNLSGHQHEWVRLDKTAPVISGAATTDPNANGWYNSDVTVAFKATDNLSGFGDAGDLKADLASKTTSGEGTDLTLTSDTISDRAGNTATALTAGPFKVDETAPKISGAATTDPNANGWYNSDVTIHWTASDALSGVSAPKDSLVSSEGTNEGASVDVYDAAGNKATGTVSGLKIDKTAPVISGAATTDPNANGWYNSDVTVAFKATDNLSGFGDAGDLKADLASKTTSGEGTDLTLTSDTISDRAGNTATALTAGPFKVDETAPEISGAATTDPNANGWYNSDVTIHWTASDALSGVSAPKDSLVSSEGTNEGASVDVYDAAGNKATGTVSGLKIDKTAPVISGAATTDPNANGWYNSDVTVAFKATDNLSGFGDAGDLKADLASKTTSGEGTDLTLTSDTISDRAGNTATALTAGPFKVDETAPEISGAATTDPNANGWYNSDVTIHWTASDALSGVSAPKDSLVSSEGTNEGASVDVYDAAGNKATGTVSGLKIDKTRPTASASATPSPNAAGWNNSDVTVNASGSDPGGSGVDATTWQWSYTKNGVSTPVTGSGASVPLSAEGTYVVSFTMSDLAGNASLASAPVTVKIDRTPPDTISLSGPIGWIASRSTTFTWTGSDNKTSTLNLVYSYKLDDGAWSSWAAATSRAYSGLSEGSHTFSVKAKDLAGNEDSESCQLDLQRRHHRALDDQRLRRALAQRPGDRDLDRSRRRRRCRLHQVLHRRRHELDQGHERGRQRRGRDHGALLLDRPARQRRDSGQERDGQDRHDRARHNHHRRAQRLDRFRQREIHLDRQRR